MNHAVSQSINQLTGCLYFIRPFPIVQSSNQPLYLIAKKEMSCYVVNLLFAPLFLYRSWKVDLLQSVYSIWKCQHFSCMALDHWGFSPFAVLPGSVGKGTTVVISPLLALITDQLEILKKANVPAISINSLLSDRERDDVEKAIGLPEGPAYKFLYLTPEQCATFRTKRLLQDLATRKFLRAVVIDEAHCISGKILIHRTTAYRRSIDWSINWLIVRWIDRLIDWLIRLIRLIRLMEWIRDLLRHFSVFSVGSFLLSGVLY